MKGALVNLLVFVNLSSGVLDGSTYDFVRAFAEPGDSVTIRYADEHSDFEALLSDAREFDAVVAVGGDGTHASVFYALRGSGVPILPFPGGTANLITQNLYSPTEAPALAKLAREGRPLDFDIAEMVFENRTVGFSMMAGCGYDATIMSDAAANKKKLGPLAYFHAAFTNPNPQVSKITLDIDGETVECEGVGVVFVNFSRIQLDIPLAVGNYPRDGYLDVMVLSTNSAWNLLPPFLGASLDHTGKPLAQSDALSYYRGKEIRVQADPPLMCQYDGDPLDLSTPFTARVLPGNARLIVGDAAYREFGD